MIQPLEWHQKPLSAGYAFRNHCANLVFDFNGRRGKDQQLR